SWRSRWGVGALGGLWTRSARPAVFARGAAPPDPPAPQPPAARNPPVPPQPSTPKNLPMARMCTRVHIGLPCCTCGCSWTGPWLAGIQWAGARFRGADPWPGHLHRPSPLPPQRTTPRSDYGVPPVLPQQQSSLKNPDNEREVFRSAGSIVLSWAWLVVAVIALIDLAVQGRDHPAAVTALAIVAISAVVYGCAWRPRIVADSSGITVANPLRDYQVP